MPQSHTLFIVASEEFRTEYLKQRKNENIRLVNSTLVGIEESPRGDLWDQKFRDRVLSKIGEFKGHAALRVRLACHFASTFGLRKEVIAGPVHQRDCSFPSRADELRAEAGRRDLDVQVWGFSHELEWSVIWAALITVEKAIEPGAGEDAKHEFERRVLKAFEKSESEGRRGARAESDWERREHLSVIAHDIMGQFNPLWLDLNTAEYREEEAAGSDDPEYRAWALNKSRELRAGVVRLLPEKLAAARSGLALAAELVPGGEANAAWKSAAAKLTDAGEQPAAALSRFRQWKDELHGLLRELAR